MISESPLPDSHNYANMAAPAAGPEQQQQLSERDVQTPQTDIQQQHQQRPTYHDVVCSHLYHTGYMQALYADLIVRLQLGGSTGTVPNGDGASPTDAVHFKLHRIIAIRSPYFASALAEMEANGEYAPVATLTIHQHDPNLTPEGLSIAFGHLYGLFSQSHLTDGSDHDLPPQQRSARLRSVLSAATLLQLDDLASLAGELIKSDISRTTVLDYCHFASHPDFGASYGKHSQDIREAVLVYLTRGVVRDVADQFGIVWGNRDGEGYKELVATFAELPFEWLKKVVESKGFEVPGDMERFNFAKEIVALRQRRRQAGGGGNPRAGGPPAGATVPNRLLAGEENVLLAFGSKDRSGVTIVRKAVRAPPAPHYHPHPHAYHHPYHHPIINGHDDQPSQSSSPPSEQQQQAQYQTASPSPHQQQQQMVPQHPHLAFPSPVVNGNPRPMSAGYGERRVWKAGH